MNEQELNTYNMALIFASHARILGMQAENMCRNSSGLSPAYDETEFFNESTEAKDAKGKPTRRARVYHIVKFDKRKAEHLERLVKGFLEAYDNLSAWDHKPLKQDDFVYGVFILIEGYLISLLSEVE